MRVEVVMRPFGTYIAPRAMADVFREDGTLEIYDASGRHLRAKFYRGEWVTATALDGNGHPVFCLEAWKQQRKQAS